jgi:RNA polymerase sigma factor (TIGR02999 family)
MSEPQPLTEWLRAAGNGDSAAAERAFTEVYTELRRLAARQLGRIDRSATLTPTALVNETFLKLTGGMLVTLDNRKHFFNLAARAMRHTIVDCARERLAQKRGGDLVRTQLDEESAVDAQLDATQALAIDQALSALEQQDENLAQTFSLRVFGGLSAEQIAELHGVTVRTVQRDLKVARNYLHLLLDSQYGQ